MMLCDVDLQELKPRVSCVVRQGAQGDSIRSSLLPEHTVGAVDVVPWSRGPRSQWAQYRVDF
jgi:hypothetical protein